jgi:CRP-like cAMP-binding protein
MGYKGRADLPSILAEVELFAALPPEGLAALATQGSWRTFRPCSQIMQQGDLEHALHIIVRGRVRLERSHPALRAPIELEQLGPGEVIGELGVLDHQPISDTVTAIEDTETVEIRAAALADIVVRFPEASAALLASLCRQPRRPQALAGQIAGDG